jgi:hypothetical protein
VAISFFKVQLQMKEVVEAIVYDRPVTVPITAPSKLPSVACGYYHSQPSDVPERSAEIILVIRVRVWLQVHREGWIGIVFAVRPLDFANTAHEVIVLRVFAPVPTDERDVHPL